MKAGWEASTLGRASIFQRGLTYSKADEVDFSDTAVLRANNIDLASNSLDLADIRYISDSVSVPKSKQVKAGSLIICTASGSKSHLGKVAYIDRDYGYAFGGFMAQITPNERLDPKFLYYALTGQAFADWLGKVSSGININNLKFSDVEHFPLSLPPLDEQRRIVAVLDKAFAGIATATANAQKNLTNARALFESYLAAHLQSGSTAGPCTDIGSEVEFCFGFAFKSNGYTDQTDGIRLLRGDNIVNGALRWEGVVRWPKVDFEAYRSFEMQTGDVVLAMDRTWVKSGLKFAVIQDADLPLLQVQRVARMRCRPSILNRYLAYQIESPAFTSYIVGIQTGLGVPHISGKQIAAFKFSKRSIQEQEKLIERLDELKANTTSLEAAYQSKLTALTELKQSLLRQAFAGELT